MVQFYIRDDDEDDIWRCTLSQLDGTSITIAGMTAEGLVHLYTGVVQSLVQDLKRDPDRDGASPFLTAKGERRRSGQLDVALLRDLVPQSLSASSRAISSPFGARDCAWREHAGAEPPLDAALPRVAMIPLSRPVRSAAARP
jgi:hypothetical protein